MTLLFAQPAGACLVARHYRPVVFAFAVSDRADQAIAPDIAARQRNAHRLGGGERGVGVLEAQNSALAGRKVTFLDDQLPVGLVNDDPADLFNARVAVEKFRRRVQQRPSPSETCRPLLCPPLVSAILSYSTSLRPAVLEGPVTNVLLLGEGFLQCISPQLAP